MEANHRKDHKIDIEYDENISDWTEKLENAC